MSNLDYPPEWARDCQPVLHDTERAMLLHIIEECAELSTACVRLLKRKKDSSLTAVYRELFSVIGFVEALPDFIDPDGTCSPELDKRLSLHGEAMLHAYRDYTRKVLSIKQYPNPRVGAYVADVVAAWSFEQSDRLLKIVEDGLNSATDFGG